MLPSVYDCVRLAAFAVALVVLAFQKTKTFLLVDAIFNFAVSVLIILRPSIVETQLTQPLDDLHKVFEQFLACISLFYVIFYCFFVRPARDEDSKNGLVACRTLALGLYSVVTVIDEWKYSGLFKSFPVSLLYLVMWVCLSAYHVYRSGMSLPRRGRTSPINLYIKIDIVLILLLSVPDLLFASYNKNFVSMKMDNLHVHMVTGIAAIHFGTAILGIYALGFRNITERKGYLCCRITVLLLIFVLSLYTIVFNKMPMTSSDMAFSALTFVPIFPALTGLFLTSDRRSFSSGAGSYNLRARRS